MNITICIGRPTIDKAASGEPVDVGHGVTILAADDLFHASPYAEIDRLRAALIAICTEAADYDTSYKPDRLKHSIMEMVASAISQPQN